MGWVPLIRLRVGYLLATFESFFGHHYDACWTNVLNWALYWLKLTKNKGKEIQYGDEMSNGLQIHKCTHRRWAHIWTSTCQEQRFPLFAEPWNHGHLIQLERQCQRLSHERFSCITQALAAWTPPRLSAGEAEYDCHSSGSNWGHF